ncbi:helix-turn-helix transcriptional regulator [Xanthomonas citri pv. malvacearum]|uniref:helix-turn-helix transcriptional regulator n=1 Tax=Xanthomonas TaxID=338 RepID=UPI0004260F07|nr:AlpA family phage regulatory protein [Xanthomonas citri]MCC4628883.1 AlpA family phage regulatory protein [Xanthomonas citri]WAW88854.1 AlpA family phage regulatory protein [Xanthomonas citri pv. malvacearum]WAW93000.1 AlpA family phage regulatory protein [Xanthomonas citri pv. malvacearum]WAW97164.1 AlpA family phage regulatory protein [Xanthomonas citri pv. malvacearum]
MEPMTSKTLINRKKLLAMIPLSERTIFNMEQRGDFPRRIALTSRNVAWDLAEIEEWIEARRSSGIQAMRPGFTPSVVTSGSAAPFSGKKLRPARINEPEAMHQCSGGAA